MGKQVEVLEHHAHVLAHLVQVVLAGIDLSTEEFYRPLLGEFKEVEAAEQRALSGAARTDQYHDLALFYVKVDALQHVESTEVLV